MSGRGCWFVSWWEVESPNYRCVKCGQAEEKEKKTLCPSSLAKKQFYSFGKTAIYQLYVE